MKYVPHAIFAFLVMSLLVGQRFGFVWAGGTGYILERNAGIVALIGEPRIDRMGETRAAELWHSVDRGETIVTQSTERLMLQLDFTHTIALDENTTITIVENTREAIRIHLTKGRIYADTHVTDGSETNDQVATQLSIWTDRTESSIESGAMTVVNYDFLEKVSVLPINTIVTITTKSEPTFTTIHPITIDDVYGEILEPNATFNVNAPDVVDFYEWARGLSIE